ncbi:RNA-dependent RNA polymerase [Rhizoctonia solani dsRNA virus 4]|uniref:RNA-dependent RNA polymerase n=1 Tax=Rhizoctonia solani dsRNA virus 4 TaxID=2045504 RepID=UPI000C059C32|nr:RNA-dependent RNA polymerase [Rhizoctonia solani dsRNA virus 4]ATN23967.1 RNA-dependent RNA polymerase [Rhizoctonia solani dsRNA virus 4]
MEYINRVLSYIFKPKFEEYNFIEVGRYSRPPHVPTQDTLSIEKHQNVMMHSMRKYLYPWEIEQIESYRRTTTSESDIERDFFTGNVEHFDPPLDENFELGLADMLDAFRPPQKCRPCHINDIEHHYPFKWQVNAEAPFSTDDYFLDNRPKISELADSKYAFLDQRYVDRLLSKQTSEMNNPVPAKFGPMRHTVFNWTRRWHHVIKDGFERHAHLKDNDPYFQNKYIFPMLLHAKTAIVKKDDPNKMRTIWGCSKPWIIADAMLYWEYIAWIKLNPGLTPMLWGYETMTGGWMRLNAALFSSYLNKCYLTLDWSRFDKRAYFSIIRRIMFGILTYLDFDNGYVPNVNYPDTKSDWSHLKSQRILRLWLWTLDNLFNAPIVLPDGRMYKRLFAGIPSGLFITQLLDSWYNYTMIATILRAMGFNPRQCIIKVQGDDSIVRLYVLIPPAKHEDFLLRMQELADHYFKSVISVDKSEIGSSLNGREVLSYRNKNGFPFRDEIKMIAQFYHTKARKSTPEIAMAQAIGFAYASCGNHDRVLSVLEDMYDHYLSQGYSPNPAGLTMVFGNSPDTERPFIDMDHFPSISEIKRFLVCTDYRNDVQSRRTWPPDYFLHPPACKPE